MAIDPVMSFHLKYCADELLNICVVWKKKVQSIPCAWLVNESWGPSDKALLQATYNQAQSSLKDENDDKSMELDEDGEGDLESGEIGDEELMDAVEEIALADEYRYCQDNEFMDDLDDIDDDHMPSSPIKSSHRHTR